MIIIIISFKTRIDIIYSKTFIIYNSQMQKHNYIYIEYINKLKKICDKFFFNLCLIYFNYIQILIIHKKTTILNFIYILRISTFIFLYIKIVFFFLY